MEQKAGAWWGLRHGKYCKKMKNITMERQAFLWAAPGCFCLRERPGCGGGVRHLEKDLWAWAN